MQFDEIGETVTITFDMDGMEALCIICQAAIDSGCDGYSLLAETFHAAFVAATLISRTAAEIGEGNRAQMAKIHARLKGAA